MQWWLPMPMPMPPTHQPVTNNGVRLYDKIKRIYGGNPDRDCFRNLVLFGSAHLCKLALPINESKTTTATAASSVSYHFPHLNIITCVVWNWYTLGEGWNYEEEQKVVDAGHG